MALLKGSRGGAWVQFGNLGNARKPKRPAQEDGSLVNARDAFPINAAHFVVAKIRRGRSTRWRRGKLHLERARRGEALDVRSIESRVQIIVVRVVFVLERTGRMIERQGQCAGQALADRKRAGQVQKIVRCAAAKVVADRA